MAISQAVCNVFKQELLKGNHDFDGGDSQFQDRPMALEEKLKRPAEEHSRQEFNAGVAAWKGRLSALRRKALNICAVQRP